MKPDTPTIRVRSSVRVLDVQAPSAGVTVCPWCGAKLQGEHRCKREAR